MMSEPAQLSLDQAPLVNPAGEWRVLDSRFPRPPVFPVFGRGEGMVWWIANGGRRSHHRMMVPLGPEYAHVWPFVTFGTVQEAEEAGYGEPCMAGTCGDLAAREAKPASRWQRGGWVRR
jgi:hypothetical protein